MQQIKEIFDQIIEIHAKVGMVGGENVYYDGTKIKTNTSAKTSKTKKLKKSEAILKKAE